MAKRGEKIWILRAKNEAHEKQVFAVHELKDMIILNRENNLGLVELLKLDPKKTFDYMLFNGKMGKSSIEDLLLHALFSMDKAITPTYRDGLGIFNAVRTRESQNEKESSPMLSHSSNSHILMVGANLP